MKRALLLTSTNPQDDINGAGLRLNTLKRILEELDFKVDIQQIHRICFKVQTTDFEIIVIHSFSALRKIVQVPDKSKLWVDLMDSWLLTRSFRKHIVTSLIKVLIDYLSISRIKSCKVITFISHRDAQKHKKFLKKFSSPLIIPNTYLQLPLLVQNTKRRLVFVGDFKYEPNLEGLLVLSKLLESGKFSFEIHCYGAIPDKKSDYHQNLIFHGYRDAEEVYNSQDIHLVPISNKSGVKNKLLIPLALGLPVICFKDSVNGVKEVPNLFIAKDPDHFSSLILNLYHQETTFRKHDLIELLEEDESNKLKSRIAELS